MGRFSQEARTAELKRQIAQHDFGIGEIEAGKVRHQTRKGDGPWEDTTENVLNYHRQTKELLEGLLRLGEQ